ncbi:MAG: glycine cleavage system protein GcvH [Puniceicoccaceae bacterium]|nr:MAG: glycine cleavage system protein GcvH [Puniceicoccaceae bacterium]
MSIPTELKYTKDHEWVRDLGDGTALVGITDYAQNNLGDVTFVELPKPGANLSAGATFGVVESVKAASDLYAPIDGEVLEVNAVLDSEPEKVNQDPYGDGWMIKLKFVGADALAGLLDAGAYEQLCHG